jgi:phosphate transport system protein
MKDSIETHVVEMGSDVAAQLRRALDALKQHDLSAADRVVRQDKLINDHRYVIEEEVEKELLSATESHRVRWLIAVLNIINDLERMGDHAEGIAKVALMLGDAAAPVPAHILEMGAAVEEMLQGGLRTFAEGQVEAARLVAAADDAVDRHYDSIYEELLATMSSDPDAVMPDTYLLWVAHNLERIADRVTNICERTIYLATGDLQETNVSAY